MRFVVIFDDSMEMADVRNRLESDHRLRVWGKAPPHPQAQM